MTRNKNGRDDETISVSIAMPMWLVNEIDSACKRTDQQRSDFVRKAVRIHILQLKDTPEFWEKYTPKNPNSLVKD